MLIRLVDKTEIFSLISDVKTISLKTATGETIEVKYSADGKIKIRHSDINAESFGEFHEYAKRIRQQGPQTALQNKGIDASSPDAKEIAERLGGYMVLRGETFLISSEETAMILEAIKKSGGIVPNWSNRP